VIHFSFPLPKDSVYTQCIRYHQLRLLENGLVRPTESELDITCDVDSKVVQPLGMEKTGTAVLAFLGVSCCLAAILGLNEHGRQLTANKYVIHLTLTY
jgi:hypothetical protein